MNERRSTMTHKTKVTATSFEIEQPQVRIGRPLMHGYLEDLHEDFPGDPSIEHGEMLQRSKHVSWLDHDIRQLAVPVLAVNHGLQAVKS